MELLKVWSPLIAAAITLMGAFGVAHFTARHARRREIEAFFRKELVAVVTSAMVELDDLIKVHKDYIKKRAAVIDERTGLMAVGHGLTQEDFEVFENHHAIYMRIYRRLLMLSPSCAEVLISSTSSSRTEENDEESAKPTRTAEDQARAAYATDINGIFLKALERIPWRLDAAYRDAMQRPYDEFYSIKFGEGGGRS